VSIDHILAEVNALSCDIAKARDDAEARSMVEDVARKIADTNEGRKLLDYTGTHYKADKYAARSAPVMTYYPTIDAICSLPRGKITIVAGMTSHGKSLFMRNLSLNVACNTPKSKVLYFCYEENREEFIMSMNHILLNRARIINGKTQIGQLTYHTLRTRRGHEIAELDDTIAEDISRRILVYDIPMTAVQLKYAMRDKLKEHPEVVAFCVDYLQRVPNEEHFYSRHTELKDTIGDMKITAHLTNTACITGAQYNQDNKNPTRKNLERMSNVYEAKEINHAAAVWLSIWDETMFDHQNGEIEEEPNIHTTKVSILKNKAFPFTLKRNLPFILDKTDGELREDKR
jgi:replicative DNA helicase